ncbi:uncharacterized protein LOC142337186 [Convolutriloba macropyga]|uniref:uncharacterized protein LOC142337186 n=1 Tax=Convolutriloba macropyga TaxID=536237 RepID=UPI003F51C378
MSDVNCNSVDKKLLSGNEVKFCEHTMSSTKRNQVNHRRQSRLADIMTPAPETLDDISGRNGTSAWLIKGLSLLALVLVILGLAVLIAETMRSLVSSYQTVTHSIKWIEQTEVYTAPAVLSKVIIYDTQYSFTTPDTESLSTSSQDVQSNGKMTLSSDEIDQDALSQQQLSVDSSSATDGSGNYIHKCQIRDRVNLTRIVVRENNMEKTPKMLENTVWYLCAGPREWRRQSWLHITVSHGWVPHGLMNTPLGTLLYILPDYEKVKKMTDTELLEAVKYARMIYVNPHTYVEISLRLLKNIDYMGYTTNHLYVYPDRSPGDANSTQAFISWGSGLYEERREVKAFSSWSVLISVCALFVTLERLHSVGTRLSSAIWKPPANENRRNSSHPESLSLTTNCNNHQKPSQSESRKHVNHNDVTANVSNNGPEMKTTMIRFTDKNVTKDKIECV